MQTAIYACTGTAYAHRWTAKGADSNWYNFKLKSAQVTVQCPP